MTHKLYFVVPSGRAQLVDRISEHLHECGDIADHLGCVVETTTDHRLLTDRSDVPYDRIDLAPDLSPEAIGDQADDSTSNETTLPKLRTEYGTPFLTPVVVSDTRYDHYPRAMGRRLVERAFGYFERVLDEFEPTVVVTPNVSCPFEWVPAQVGGRHGTYLWWKTTRVGSRYGFIEGTHREEFCGIDDWTAHGRRETDGTDAERMAREYLSSVRESGSRPNFYARRADSYGDSLRKLIFPYGIPGPREIDTLLRNRLSAADDFDDQRLPRPRNVWRRLRIGADDPFEQPRSDERFVFFPLHAQPEPSTRVLAPMFEDQATLARQVARSLPVDCHLYVKDHPRMFRDNTRSLEYYRDLKDTSGVRVLAPTADSHTLIRKSSAVVSVVGTPAMEAAFFGTPSVVFGPAHFTALPSVRRCRSLDGLSDLLSWALSEPDCSESDLLGYLSALFEHSFEIPAAASGLSPDAQQRLADHVAPELGRQLRTL